MHQALPVNEVLDFFKLVGQFGFNKTNDNYNIVDVDRHIKFLTNFSSRINKKLSESSSQENWFEENIKNEKDEKSLHRNIALAYIAFKDCIKECPILTNDTGIKYCNYWMNDEKKCIISNIDRVLKTIYLLEVLHCYNELQRECNRSLANTPLDGFFDKNIDEKKASIENKIKSIQVSKKDAFVKVNFCDKNCLSIKYQFFSNFKEAIKISVIREGLYDDEEFTIPVQKVFDMKKTFQYLFSKITEHFLVNTDGYIFIKSRKPSTNLNVASNAPRNSSVGSDVLENRF